MLISFLNLTVKTKLDFSATFFMHICNFYLKHFLIWIIDINCSNGFRFETSIPICLELFGGRLSILIALLHSKLSFFCSMSSSCGEGSPMRSKRVCNEEEKHVAWMTC